MKKYLPAFLRRAFRPAPQLRSRNGMALVLILAAIALVTGTIMNFFSRVMSQRFLSLSSVKQIEADINARTALDFIVGQFREQIRAGSTRIEPPQGPAVYRPIADTAASNDYVQRQPSMLPQRDADTIAANGDPNHLDPTQSEGYNLVRVSKNTPFFEQTGVYAFAGATYLTAGETDDKAWNGRVISDGSLAASEMVTEEIFGKDGCRPGWHILTKSGPAKQGDSTIQDWSNSRSPKAAVGRFAYVVYDEGGLLDMNAAGHPTSNVDSTFGQEPFFRERGRKGSMAYADLSDLTGVKQDDLAKWRNKVTSTKASDYVAYATSYDMDKPAEQATAQKFVGFASKFSFTVAYEGDNQFLSRQDLLRARASGLVGLDQDDAIMRYFSHFSRAATAPSFEYLKSPPANYPNWPIANSDANPSLIETYYTGAVPYTAPDGFQLTKGMQLVARKFPLSRINKLTPTATAVANSDINKYFGLIRANASEPWVYAGVGGSSAAAKIKTLTEVQADKREPDFFELLKAVIHKDSLGVAFVAGGDLTQLTVSSQDTKNLAALSPLYDRNRDIQIIRIGANLMDQWDEDDYPTVIKFNPDLTTATSFSNISGPFELYGSENIPALTGIDARFRTMDYPTDPGQATRNFIALFIPQVVMPYRPRVGTTLNTPDIKFRMEGRARFYGTAANLIAKDMSASTGVWTIPKAQFTRYQPLNTANQIPGDYALSRRGPRLLEVTGASHTLPDPLHYKLGFVSGGNAIYDRINNGANAPEVACIGLTLGDAFSGGAFPTTSGSPPTYGSLMHPTYGGNVVTGLPSNGMNAVLSYTTPAGGDVPYSVLAGSAGQTRTGLGINSDAQTTRYRTFDYTKVPFKSATDAVTAGGALSSSNSGDARARRPVNNTNTYHKFDRRTSRFGLAYKNNSRMADRDIRIVTSKSPWEISWLTNPPEATIGIGQTSEGPKPKGAPGGPADPVVGLGTNLRSHRTLDNNWEGHNTDNCLRFSSAALSENRVRNKNDNIADRSHNFYYDNFGTEVGDQWDGRVRPADAAYIGIYLDQQNKDALTRQANCAQMNPDAMPIILNRPFRSVGELGYVFRDMPNKSLDLFSMESCDAGLMDVFSLGSEGVGSSMVGGVVNINTARPHVLQAILANTTYIEDAGNVATANDQSPPFNDDVRVRPGENKEAYLYSREMIRKEIELRGPLASLADMVLRLGTFKLNNCDFTVPETYATHPQGPLDADVAAKIKTVSVRGTRGNSGTTDLAAVSGAPDAASRYLPAVKTEREAYIRALAGTTQARTWTFMIEVIAQTGKFPPKAKSDTDFLVEGEKRYWMHVSIDRITGAILDQKIEAVEL
jgi:hypothetical protein